MDFHVIVRPAQNNDTRNLTELNSRLGYPANEQTVFSILEKVLTLPDQQVYLAEINKKVTGYIHLVRKTEPSIGTLVDIAALVIHESARGKGAGTELIKSAIQWTSSNSIASLQIRGSMVQPVAYRFFENHGFLHIQKTDLFVKDIAISG